MKRESITITAQAYNELVREKEKRNDDGIPASLGGIASEAIIRTMKEKDEE